MADHVGVYVLHERGAYLIATVPPSPVPSMQETIVRAAKRAAAEAGLVPNTITAPTNRFPPLFLSSDVAPFDFPSSPRHTASVEKTA